MVGTGDVARQYAAGLRESPLSLVGVCDRDRDRAAAFRSSLAGDVGDDLLPSVYGDLDRMLNEEAAPLAVNLTGHAAHADVTRACLDAGRHVFSEKPLALDPTEAADLLERARARDLALGCAPINVECDAQRHALTLRSDGRLGAVRLAYAHAHVGRVTEWHDRPDSYLSVGPLYDGAVYPLSLLVDWFGPVDRVRTADAVDAWPARERRRPEAPAHVEATLEFAAGPTVSLRASLYADHRSREFYSVELHGDDGTLYIEDCGALAADRDAVRVRGGDRESVPAPHPRPRRVRSHLAGPERVARRVARGERPRASAVRAAHVVAVCAAVAAEATDPAGGGRPVGGVDAASLSRGGRVPPSVRPAATGRPPRAALRLPPVGLGRSRDRDGEDADAADPLGTALDAGCRLFDTAGPSGIESRLGGLLDAPGTPDRDALFLLGGTRNATRGGIREACEGSLAALGVDALDCYALRRADSPASRGPPCRSPGSPADERESATRPADDGGTRATADRPLADAWRDLAALRDDGLARTIGVRGVGLDRLRGLVAETGIEPALVGVERNPYEPRSALVEWCHARGIRVVARSPLSAPGLLADHVVREAAADADTTPAAAVLAWNVADGVVPLPSIVDPERVVDRLAAARVELDDGARARLDGLVDRDPGVER